MSEGFTVTEQGYFVFKPNDQPRSYKVVTNMRTVHILAYDARDAAEQLRIEGETPLAVYPAPAGVGAEDGSSSRVAL
jgi:hypothetical protein